MQSKLILAVALSLSAAACSSAPAPESTPSTQPSAPAASAAVNPVGRFEFSTTVQGQPVTGGVEVAGTPGAYTGQITTSVTPPLPISSVAVSGQEMVVTGSTPDGVVTIRMTFTEGGAFTGRWELAGDGGSITGRRVP